MSEPDARTAGEAQVIAAMRAVYEGFLTGDPARVDALLADDVTIWDSAEFALVRGQDGLSQLRSRRVPSEVGVARLELQDPVVDLWGDTALLRHVLRVQFTDDSTEVVRNTSVWRRDGEGWRAVHNHEDVAGGGASP